MSLLRAILESKGREIEELRARSATFAARASGVGRATARRVAHDVVRALRRPAGEPLRFIAEVKFKSPSAGGMSRALDCPARAVAYAAGGAAMVSVLCDGPYFDGGFHHLAAARARLDREGLVTPLLAKEFVLDEVQITAARDHGADAVLLIARIVTPARLCDLTRASRDAGLEPFVEVVDERELDAAVAAGAHVLGVNARDLDTLAMDAARTARVLARIPAHCVAVHLSGLRGAPDVRAIAASRADAALVGELLMRADDPTPLLVELHAAAR